MRVGNLSDAPSIIGKAVVPRAPCFEVAHLRQLLAQSGIFLVFLQARSASEWNSRRCATRSLASASGLYRLESATSKAQWPGIAPSSNGRPQYEPQRSPTNLFRIGFFAAMFAFCLVGQLPCLTANDTTSEGVELFEKSIRPALIEHCQRCHGKEKQQANLRLDSRQGWLTGGDNGTAIEPGDVGSLLLTAIRYEDPDLEMPPKGKLPDSTIKAFERWVELGAADPRDDAADEPPAAQQMSPSVAEGKSFWSFQPVIAPQIPDVKSDKWPANDIDRFVLAKIEQNGLQPSPQAEPRTLLRRLYYDLIGLPPTSQQISEFLADPSPQAYEQTVLQLLASDEFGQRWGRHWLDVVRYAESSGGGRTLLFPDAWRYRDYVIDSFNRDVRFNRFITEQIAGDLIPYADWQQRRRNLIATGFLLLGPTNYELQDKEVLEMDVVDEQLDTMGKAFLGMTIGCARCHDHKFDPIPTTDYYAMAGILKSSRSLKHANVSEWNTADLPLSPEESKKASLLSERLKDAKQQASQLRKRWLAAGGIPEVGKGKKSIPVKNLPGVVVDDQQAELVGNWNKSQSNKYFVGENYLYGSGGKEKFGRVVFRPDLPEDGRYEIQISYSPGDNRSTDVPIQIDHADGQTTTRVDQRTAPPIGGKFESLGMFNLSAGKQTKVTVSGEGVTDGVVIADAVIFISKQDDLEPGADAPQIDVKQVTRLRKELDEQEQRVEEIRKSIPKPPPAMAIADRDQPGDIHLAIRGVTHSKGELVPRGILRVAAWEDFPQISAAASGRLELARWIADSNNPLTARVVVNRIWYWLIGRGIVPTVDNFGSMGQPPSHPELLDHLATQFVNDGRSIKRLIQRILMSQTYRQRSTESALAHEVDPDNRWLSRMNRKRLRAEDIRDTVLFVAGQLDLRAGGSDIKPGTKREYGYQFDSFRRSVYLPVFRNTLPEIFEVFDFADPNIQRGQRSSSTVSSQALLMMNHPFVIEQSRAAASRNLADADLAPAARIDLAYLQVIGRPPTKTEVQIGLDLIGDSDQNKGDGLALLYQILFQCIDFRYLN